MLKIFIPALVFFVSVQVTAQDASLPQCQGWQNKIDYYSNLRKKGGRAQQMESWKQARAVYEDKFQTNKCRKYGKKIK